MGCFDFHCAVTSISVSNYDEVLHVVKKWDTEDEYRKYGVEYSIYDLWQDFGSADREKDHNVTFHRWCIERGYHTDIPEPEPDKPIDILRDLHNVSIRWGEYNDYGWIEKGNRPADNTYLHFMVHKDVALQIAAFCKRDPNDIFEVGRAVAEFLFVCRINPWWNLAGVQSYDQTEHKYQLRRIELIQHVMNDIKSKWWEED